MRETLGPGERIRKKSDFLHIYKKGTRFRGQYFNLIYLLRPSDPSRVGVVAGRKVGSAVVRNRIKRWMRDTFRRNKRLLIRPLDLVVVARSGIAEITRREFDGQFLAALERIMGREASSTSS